MVAALATLLGCQLAGEALGRLVSAPIPGPVIGMIVLIALIATRTPLPAQLDEAANGLPRHLSLFFVPAGVGVVQHLDRLGTDGIQLLLVVILATAVTLIVTAVVFDGLTPADGRLCPAARG